MSLEKRQEFGVMVQQLSHEELEQLHAELTDSGQLRLVRLELERHEMIKADKARNSLSTPEPAGGNGIVDVPEDVLADEQSREIDREMSELVATRRRLALSAAQGDKKAATKLDEIEKEITALTVARERAVLAEEESNRRAVEDKRRREEQERNEREILLGELAHQRLGIDEKIQSSVKTLVTNAGRLLDIGGEMENIAVGLGRPGHYLRPRDNVVSYLNSSLAALLPYDFPHPHSSRRGKLVEMEGSLLADFLSTRESK